MNSNEYLQAINDKYNLEHKMFKNESNSILMTLNDMYDSEKIPIKDSNTVTYTLAKSHLDYCNKMNRIHKIHAQLIYLEHWGDNIFPKMNLLERIIYGWYFHCTWTSLLKEKKELVEATNYST